MRRFACLAMIALSSCNTAPIQSDQPISKDSLVGCYAGSDDWAALEIRLAANGTYKLNVQIDIGSLDSAEGAWTLKSNKIFLSPDKPGSRPFGLNWPIYIYRDGNEFALQYQDAKGKRTTNWGKLARHASCT